MKFPQFKILVLGKWVGLSFLWLFQFLGALAAVLAVALVFRLFWEFLRFGWHLWDLIVKHLH